MTVTEEIPRWQTMSSEELAEVADDVIRGINESAKKWADWFQFSDPRFVEHYVEGSFEIVIRLDIGGLDRSLLLCAAVPNRVADRITDPSGVGDLDHVLATSCDQQPMLIRDIQLMQNPQVMVLPFFVRFERTERLADFLSGPTYLLLNKGADVVFVPRFVTEEGESGGPIPLRFWNGLPSEVVQRARKIVNRVPDNQSQGYLISSEPVPYLPRLRVTIGQRGYSVKVSDDDLDKGVSVTDVLIGPVNLAGDPSSYRAARHDRLPFVSDSR